ncbi:MAG TPA: helix-turn-helix domain-containing protein [Eubacteriales bacterium]|nr:helix-turn-helix domain-containing protein [Clostridia bacterium]HRV73044.1 helix-turn-helix domain-containing protein [Eubacteriales bacterium]
MDIRKTGELIRGLRLEHGMTQKQLAEKLCVSDRTVSKWERGAGCPDVSLLPRLSELFGVDTMCLLTGELSPNKKSGGNMRRLQFYVCPICGNVLTATSGSELSCCGSRLSAEKPKAADEEHRLTAWNTDGEWYVTMEHPMTKEHYIRFIAYVSWDRMLIVRLYPEQDAALRMPVMRGGKFVFCCSGDGMYEQKI